MRLAFESYQIPITSFLFSIGKLNFNKNPFKILNKIENTVNSIPSLSSISIYQYKIILDLVQRNQLRLWIWGFRVYYIFPLKVEFLLRISISMDLYCRHIIFPYTIYYNKWFGGKRLNYLVWLSSRIVTIWTWDSPFLPFSNL